MAGMRFAAYEGRDSITEGQGGTKVEKDGVEFWTSGAPPHRYQVLGLLADERGTGIFHPDAVGSANVAKRIRDLGGDGAIVLGRDSQVSGAMLNGYGQVMVARRNSTRMMVVKYLPAPTPSPPSQ